MFKQIRFANVKIKEIYGCQNQQEISKFKTRFASVIDKFENNKLAQRNVVAIEPHYVYLVVSGLHGNEANDNGDYFKWEELLKKKVEGMYTFETWIGKPVLENHNAQHVRGMIVDAWPIEKERSIDFLLRVDERINPNLVKGIRNGSIKGTSMGVMVGHSYCNICNNLAHDESEWCEHLNPSKLNIKGKLYTGQDGNKFPEKIGIICYEDNRDLEGVEDSIISLGEPADPKALAKTVLAISNKDEGNSQMINNDRQAIAAKRAEMLKNPRAGIRESTRVSSARDSGGGNPGTVDPKALQRAVADLMRKKGLAANGLYATPEKSVTYESSGEVVTAIKEGKLGKRDAIAYVEKFKLVSADKVDELSSSEAFNLLVKDSEEEQVHKEVLRSASDLAISEGDAKPEESQPTPDGTIAPEKQMPSNDSGDQASDTNSAKPEESQPKPDGTIAPEKQMPSNDSGDQASDTNKAKPEEKQPAPKTASEIEGSDLAIDLKEAKPEEKQPEPKDISQVNDTPKVDTSDLAVDLKEAAPEDQPEPVKAQLEEEKEEKEEYSEEELEKMTPLEKVDEALEELQDALKLIKDVKPDVPKEIPEEEKEEGGEETEEKEEKEEEIKETIEEMPSEELPPLPAEEEIPEELPMGGEEFPAILGYKVELIKDDKSPEDSYYVVSLNKNPVFSITARQAWGKQVKAELNTFVSPEYAKALKSELNKSGAKKVYATNFGSLGIVLAQEEKLPEDTFGEPAKDMNIEEKPLKDITNDDTESQNFTDMIADVLASVLAQSDGASPEEIVEELKTTFTSSELASEFSGILREKYEQKQKEKSLKETPEVYSEEAVPEELPTELPELKEAAKKLQVKVASIGKLLPEIKLQLKALQDERDSYKAKYGEMLHKAQLKARISYTKAVADRKADLGLISEDESQKEALRLAKLSDGELKNEIKSLENSVKIAQKISKKSDYSDVEGNNKNKREAVGTVLTNIPSQFEEEASAEVRGKTFSWSKGFPGRNK